MVLSLKPLCASLFVAALTMGCRSGAAPALEPLSEASSVARGLDAPATTSPPRAVYAFECDDAQRFVLTQVAGKPDAIDLAIGDRHERLTHVRAASGAQYTAEGISVWTKGRDAMLEIAGRVTTCREDPRRSILEDARARGVELRASGHEPGWVLELLADRMVFVGAYGAQRVTTPRASAASASPPGAAVYAGTAGGHRLTARVLPGPCFDTMSGDQLAARVEVEVDGKTYRGCGEALR